MFPPEFARWNLLLEGLVESLQIAIIASIVGILLALPIGLMAARNLMPAVVTVPMRALIAVARSFHPIIVAIVFVKAIGFGALAGILALILASIGFVGKLFAEAIEEISLKQVEAVRATGASFMGVVIMAVLPAGDVVLHRLLHLQARQKPQKSDDGGHRRRRRQSAARCFGLPALRIRSSWRRS
jgi:phosphonate transport system permease protein